MRELSVLESDAVIVFAEPVVRLELPTVADELIDVMPSLATGDLASGHADRQLGSEGLDLPAVLDASGRSSGCNCVAEH
jgi:hypothetical protein